MTHIGFQQIMERPKVHLCQKKLMPGARWPKVHLLCQVAKGWWLQQNQSLKGMFYNELFFNCEKSPKPWALSSPFDVGVYYEFAKIDIWHQCNSASSGKAIKDRVKKNSDWNRTRLEKLNNTTPFKLRRECMSSVRLIFVALCRVEMCASWLRQFFMHNLQCLHFRPSFENLPLDNLAPRYAAIGCEFTWMAGEKKPGWTVVLWGEVAS